jgi:L-lactate dehydrogenase complex protein LldE
MHYNTGYQREALPLMRNFLRVYAESEVICAPSSSCVAMIRDHFPKMARASGETELIALAGQVVPRVFEFTELLTDRLRVIDVGAFYPHTVTLHPSCHGLRALDLGDKPRRLLESVRGLRLLDLPEAEQCCGFGGTFAIKNPDVSGAMLADKMRCVLNTGAEVCTATDNSCLMHIQGALSRMRTGVRCMHLAEILAATA